MFELIDNKSQSAVIKVFGVGGGGSNAVKHMIANNVEGVEFICANTDSQALMDVDVKTILQLGSNITKGLGAGANPEVGRQAAMEDRDRIAELLRGSDMVFITAGMGGGTGTGAAPVVAEVAKELGILSVAVVTKPFKFEGKKRMQLAEEGIKELAQYVDSIITIPNQKLEEILGGKITLKQAFAEANNVLHRAVQGIADLIINPGEMNVDFADVRTIMSEMGMAMMGTGVASGENRAVEAAKAAINSPLLDDIDIQGARGILVNITAGENLELGEFTDVGDTIEEFASEHATIVIGTVFDPSMTDEIKVTVVATGLGLPLAQSASKPEAAVVRDKVAVEPPLLELGLAANSRVDYAKYDKSPASRREQRLHSVSGAAIAVDRNVDTESIEFLDIPAFLRRQAD